jgi:hypothetical protein
LQPDAVHVTAHLPNTSRRSLVARRHALALLLAGLLAGGLAACGGAGSPSAASLVRDTFTSHKPIESGRIDLSFALTPTGSSAGSPAAGRPFQLGLQGPFQSLGPARLPRFALALTLTSAGHTLQAGATSTSGQLYIELAGAYFTAPASTVQALQQGYAQATRTSSSAASQSTFAALGVDPGEWLARPRIAGTADIAGTQTTHVTGELDVTRFLADAEKLSGAGGALGLGGAGAGGLSLLSPAGIKALAGSVRSARVDLYTGASDHLLRRLSLSATIATTPQTSAALGGLGSATLALTLQFAGLNQSQSIAAPSNPQPITKLLPDLERLGLALGAGAAS